MNATQTLCRGCNRLVHLAPQVCSLCGSLLIWKDSPQIAPASEANVNMPEGQILSEARTRISFHPQTTILTDIFKQRYLPKVGDIVVFSRNRDASLTEA